jgi:hypothetical protein
MKKRWLSLQGAEAKAAMDRLVARPAAREDRQRLEAASLEPPADVATDPMAAAVPLGGDVQRPVTMVAPRVSMAVPVVIAAAQLAATAGLWLAITAAVVGTTGAERVLMSPVGLIGARPAPQRVVLPVAAVPRMLRRPAPAPADLPTPTKHRELTPVDGPPLLIGPLAAAARTVPLRSGGPGRIARGPAAPDVPASRVRAREAGPVAEIRRAPQPQPGGSRALTAGNAARVRPLVARQAAQTDQRAVTTVLPAVRGVRPVAPALIPGVTRALNAAPNPVIHEVLTAAPARRAAGRRELVRTGSIPVPEALAQRALVGLAVTASPVITTVRAPRTVIIVGKKSKTTN